MWLRMQCRDLASGSSAKRWASGGRTVGRSLEARSRAHARLGQLLRTCASRLRVRPASSAAKTTLPMAALAFDNTAASSE